MVLIETKKRKKICLFSLGAVLLCGVIALCAYGIFFGGLTQEEKEYKKSPSEQNLIELCNSLMFTEQYDKKIEYMPEALKLDEEDYEKIYEKTTPAKGQDGNEIKSYSAYREMIMEYIFAYIHTKRYDELQEVFPKTFCTIVGRIASANFKEHLLETEELSESDYRLFLKMLEDCEADYIEPNLENGDELFEKQQNMRMQAEIHLILGEQEQHKKLSQKISDYNKWYFENFKEEMKEKNL